MFTFVNQKTHVRENLQCSMFVIPSLEKNIFTLEKWVGKNQEEKVRIEEA